MFWSLGSPRSGCWQSQCLLGAYFLAHRQLPPLCVLTWPFLGAWVWRELSSNVSSSSYKGTNPIVWAPPL